MALATAAHGGISKVPLEREAMPEWCGASPATDGVASVILFPGIAARVPKVEAKPAG
jgi:hypothetical protein